MPNPESALNEEAGKLLLESHDEYAERAKMMTEIHAQVIFYLISLKFCFSSITLWHLNHFIKIILILFQGGGKGSKAGLESCAEAGGPLPKKHAGDKKLTAEKKKMLKDKKRTLKRL